MAGSSLLGVPGTRYSYPSWLVIRRTSSPPAPATPGLCAWTITPQQVERVEPVGSQMSVLVPDAQEMQKNVVTSFCHFVHFFPSRQAAQSWTAKHAGTFLLSIHEAHVLARLKNEAQYRDVLK